MRDPDTGMRDPDVGMRDPDIGMRDTGGQDGTLGTLQKGPGNGKRDSELRTGDLGGDPGIERRDSGGQERILVTE